MKAVLLMFDSLNRRMLPPYGGDWVHAPNFQRLARRTVTFDNCYIGSMPCMPARREFHTGRYNFMHRSWGPLEPFDDSMPELLSANSVYTHLVTDHTHYFEDGGATYHTRYNSWEFNRGQEGDNWKGFVNPPFAIPPVTRRMERNQNNRMWTQEFINRQYMPTPETQPQALTFSQGIEFIRHNQHEDQWFLHLETFDPHEPFFTHQAYKDLYPDEYDGPLLDWISYGRVTEDVTTVHHLRNEYAALVSYCDDQLGRLLDVMDELDLWRDTLLIVCTDHGLLLGEHDWWGKNVAPWYNENAHTPLFIWDPRCGTADERRNSLVQLIDLPATLLEYFDVPLPVDMEGRPLRATIAADQPVREAALFGAFGGHINVTDGRYVYMRAPAPGNQPLYEYTLMPTHIRTRFTPTELQNATLAPPFTFTKGCPVLRLPGRPWGEPTELATMLFDAQADPGQLHPLQDTAVEARMRSYLIDLMRRNDAPAEQFARLGLADQGG
ncbi:MAG: sulfatase [Chloroflexi bacterium]|nr:sulfatase [Chloroflexota bacterium]